MPACLGKARATDARSTKRESNDCGETPTCSASGLRIRPVWEHKLHVGSGCSSIALYTKCDSISTPVKAAAEQKVPQTKSTAGRQAAAVGRQTADALRTLVSLPHMTGRSALAPSRFTGSEPGPLFSDPAEAAFGLNLGLR